MVVAVLDTGADSSRPRSPQTVTDPAFTEGSHAGGGRPVGGIACVEGVREIVVLNLDRVSCGGYPREKIPVPADGVREESSSILHRTYATLVVSISTPLWAGLREMAVSPGPTLSDKCIVS